MTLQRRGEIAIDLHGAAAHVVMGDGDDAKSRGAGPAHAARQQTIAEPELPPNHVARLVLQSRSLHTALYIKNDANDSVPSWWFSLGNRASIAPKVCSDLPTRPSATGGVDRCRRA